MSSEIGKKYGHLTIMEDTSKRYHGSIVYKCLCDCGNYKEVNSNQLHSGHVTSCGCARHMVKDLTGMRFGKLTVLSFAKREKGKTYWNCKCDCGNECIASADSLHSGATKSCGCINRENRKNIVNLNAGFVDGTCISAIDGRRKINKNNKSGYIGISYDVKRKLWVAQLQFQGKNHLIGRFKYKRDAVKARKEAEIIYYGKYRKK